MATKTPTFYVFHGSDEFSRAETLDSFKRRLGQPEMGDLNTTTLTGRKVSLAELRHHCDAVPFLAEKRLVIVEGLLTRISEQQETLADLAEYLLQLPETTRLVFVENKALSTNHPILKLAQQEKRGYVKQFEPPRDSALPGWVSKRVEMQGGDIGGQAAAHLAALVGADLRLLDQEIIKLVTYTNGERQITTEDVDQLVPYAQAAIIFDLVDALGRRDGPTAAQTLHRLLDAGEHPLGLLAMIARQFRLLIQVKELKGKNTNPQAIAKALGIHPFPARKLYQQATHFTAPQLETVHRHLLDTDVAIKSGKIEPQVALDLLVAGLAS